MKTLNCAQGSDEWVRAHLGRPTASSFHRFIEPGSGKLSRNKAGDGLSDKALGYAASLAAEWCNHGPVDDVASPWMLRGQKLEAEARDAYAFIAGMDVIEVGMCLTDDGLAGCSPDGLVGEEGGVEIKTCKLDKHLFHILRPNSFTRAHYPQVQASLWITGRQWWDVYSWNPLVSMDPIRVERDEEYIAAIALAVEEFTAHLGEAMVRLGLWPTEERPDAI